MKVMAAVERRPLPMGCYHSTARVSLKKGEQKEVPSNIKIGEVWHISCHREEEKLKKIQQIKKKGGSAPCLG